MENKALIKNAREIMEEISCKYNQFSTEYFKYTEGIISFEDLVDLYMLKLSEMTEEERMEYNEMHKMFSMSNCWYADYRAGELLHTLIVKLKYGEDMSWVSNVDDYDY
jgi:hypothetical protein